jgi:hypothetical protein
MEISDGVRRNERPGSGQQLKHRRTAFVRMVTSTRRVYAQQPPYAES